MGRRLQAIVCSLLFAGAATAQPSSFATARPAAVVESPPVIHTTACMFADDAPQPTPAPATGSPFASGSARADVLAAPTVPTTWAIETRTALKPSGTASRSILIPPDASGTAKPQESKAQAFFHSMPKLPTEWSNPFKKSEGKPEPGTQSAPARTIEVLPPSTSAQPAKTWPPAYIEHTPTMRMNNQDGKLP